MSDAKQWRCDRRVMMNGITAECAGNHGERGKVHDAYILADAYSLTDNLDGPVSTGIKVWLRWKTDAPILVAKAVAP